MAGGNISVYLPEKHLKYVVENIGSISSYVQAKIEEDMESNIPHLERKAEDMELQKTLLHDKIEKLKKLEEERKQHVNKLIKEAKGRKGDALRNWAEGWRADIARCALSIDQFIEVAEKVEE